MSIPVLTQVYDEVRRLAIAGSAVAPGDFRLKKLIAPLEQAGQKAPVFAKLAQAARQLVESTDKTSAEALLELSTLVNAILYTQGETGIKGTLEPVKTVDLGLSVTQTSARVLKPLLEALTSTGSGRMEIIQEAHQRGAFADLRLIKAVIGALDDTYSEIADFVGEQILPMYGQAILPELRARFDPKGRGGNVRRLVLMHKLDPAGTRDTVQRALEEGSKEVKVGAIECLGESPDDVAFLLDQAKSKNKEVRGAALRGLSRSNSPEAVAALRTAFTGKDIGLAIVPLRESQSPELLRAILEAAEAQFNLLLDGKKKDKKEVEQQGERFVSQLECLRDRDDKLTEKFLLACFERREELSAIKGDVSGQDIQERLVATMAAGSKRTKAALAEAHTSLSSRELSDAFRAAWQAWSPAQVYDEFSPYLALPGGKKPKRGDAAEKRAEIVEAVGEDGHWRRYFSSSHARAGDGQRQKFDPRWLDLAVEQQELELVQALAKPGHAAAGEFLAHACAEMLNKLKSPWELSGILGTMIEMQHPAATDLLIAAIAKTTKGTHAYGLYSLGQLIPHLPKSALPALEALLPTLPDKAVDTLLDYVTQLKNKEE
ncbi:MAG: HEAT repeat domain-containing protein [Pirellulales bacterium]